MDKLSCPVVAIVSGMVIESESVSTVATSLSEDAGSFREEMSGGVVVVSGSSIPLVAVSGDKFADAELCLICFVASVAFRTEEH